MARKPRKNTTKASAAPAAAPSAIEITAKKVGITDLQNGGTRTVMAGDLLFIGDEISPEDAEMLLGRGHAKPQGSDGRDAAAAADHTNRTNQKARAETVMREYDRMDKDDRDVEKERSPDEGINGTETAF